MIEIGENSEYTQLVADFIGNLMAVEEQGKDFEVTLVLTGYDNPIQFDSNYDVEFLQEGIRLNINESYTYVLYDIIDIYGFVIL